ncbi:MAG: flagellar basal body rod protein FlgB [Holophagales bacterium]|jgi:flagellar basal-body rod protein FlgB|nr:flagellar basal body rod protein FlgB [Holophagales bacterium]
MFDLLSKTDMVTTMDKTMTVASRRMGLVASNMANIDTPDYRTRDFPFHEVLKDVLDNKPGQSLPIVRTHPMHMCGEDTRTLPYALDRAITTYERNDGNDVNLDKENMKVMQTQGTFNQAALFTQTAIRRVLNAIREGGRS